jgi:uncharacterized protein (DUF305 family)
MGTDMDTPTPPPADDDAPIGGGPDPEPDAAAGVGAAADDETGSRSSTDVDAGTDLDSPADTDTDTDTDTDVGTGTDADADSDVVEEEPAQGLSWGRVAVLGVALTFLGFAIGFTVTRDRPPAADSADVGFLQDMITHHDQALGVAALTSAYGEDPTVRVYAREVLTFQSYEIGVMTQKLRDWGYTREERSDEAMAWMDMAVPLEQMPGLLTDDELDQVREAEGAELDRLFLELMAEHHRGGLHMAEEGARLAEDDDVAALAARIEHNQAGEINLYRMAAESLGFDVEIEPADVPPADLPPAGG